MFDILEEAAKLEDSRTYRDDVYKQWLVKGFYVGKLWSR